MNKTFYTALYLFISYLLYGLFISQYQISIVDEQIGHSPESQKIYDYRGVLNVHSNLSSGTGSLKKVFDAAENTGLDFLFMTDLNTFPIPIEQQGYHNKVLTFIDGEYSFLDSRFLYLNQNARTPITNLGQAGAVLSEHLSRKVLVQEKTSERPMAILAHPTKKGFQWSGDYPQGLDGLEIINLKALWQNSWLHKKITFVWSFLIYPFNPELAFLRLFQRAEPESKIWDQLNQSRLRVAFAGSDAESKFNFFQTPLKFPSYEVLFNIVNNHILIPSELTGNYLKDKKKVFSALSKGQFYMSLEMIGSPVGFNFYAEKQRKKIYMGSTLALQKNTYLKISVPEKVNVPFKVQIVKDGEVVETFRNFESKYLVKEAGTYRALIYTKISLPFPEGRKWFPWIFTNGIKFL